MDQLLRGDAFPVCSESSGPPVARGVGTSPPAEPANPQGTRTLARDNTGFRRPRPGTGFGKVSKGVVTDEAWPPPPGHRGGRVSPGDQEMFTAFCVSSPADARSVGE